MSSQSNSNTLSGDNLIQISQEKTDALLELVNEKITCDSFDKENNKLIEQMVESLGDKRGMVRLTLVEAFGQIGEPAIPFLVHALTNHSNVVVRRASAKALAQISDPRVVPNLIHALLNDEDNVVRSSSAGALARTGKPAVNALFKILASPDISGSIKGQATWALSFIGAEAKDELYNAISSELPEIRCAVVGAIYDIVQEASDERGFEILMSSLTDSSDIVRSESAATIGKLKYKPAIPTLLELLQHQKEETRKAAALALMKIGDRFAIEPLQSALDKEQITSVQSIIKLAISQIQKQSEEDDW